MDQWRSQPQHQEGLLSLPLSSSSSFPLSPPPSSPLPPIEFLGVGGLEPPCPHAVSVSEVDYTFVDDTFKHGKEAFILNVIGQV